MKKKRISIIVGIFIAIMMATVAVMLTACPDPVVTPPELTGISITTPTRNWTVGTDPTDTQARFVATAQPSGATLPDISWSVTAGGTYVSINADGVASWVTEPAAAGSATVQAAGGGFTATATINWTAPTPPDQLTGIAITTPTRTWTVGEAPGILGVFTVTAEPSTVAPPTITWSVTAGSTYVSINDSGVASWTATAPTATGSATIQAAGGGFTATATVNWTVATPPAPPLTNITISPSATLNWSYYDTTAPSQAFTATRYPATADMGAVTWASTNPAVVTINPTTGVANLASDLPYGTGHHAYIYASYDGVSTATLNRVRINVTGPTANIPLEDIIISLPNATGPDYLVTWIHGQPLEVLNRTFTPSAYPVGASLPAGIVWNSSNENLIAIANGVATIASLPTATSYYSEIYVTFNSITSNVITIYVEIADPTGVEIVHEGVQGDAIAPINWVIGADNADALTAQFTRIFTPSYAQGDVIWYSTNPAFVVVDADGVASLPSLLPTVAGHSYIRVYVDNGDYDIYSFSVRINVSFELLGITIGGFVSADDLIWYSSDIDPTITFTATPNPTAAVFVGDVVWTSSHANVVIDPVTGVATLNLTGLPYTDFTATITATYDGGIYSYVELQVRIAAPDELDDILLTYTGNRAWTLGDATAEVEFDYALLDDQGDELTGLNVVVVWDVYPLGLVTITDGVATFTANATENAFDANSIAVTVTARVGAISSNPITITITRPDATSFGINYVEANLLNWVLGGTHSLQLSVYRLPTYAAVVPATWTSSNPNVIYVNADGSVAWAQNKVAFVGSVTITAAVAGLPNQTIVITVTRPAVASVTINYETADLADWVLDSGSTRTVTLTYTLNPQFADGAVTWSSNREDLLVVTNGVVSWAANATQAATVGAVVITARYNLDIYATVIITVARPQATASTIVLPLGATTDWILGSEPEVALRTLSLALVPSYAEPVEFVQWASSETGVATVAGWGATTVITAVGEGTTIITASAVLGTGLTAATNSITITITRPALTGIEISSRPLTYTWQIGGAITSHHFGHTFIPAGAAGIPIWSSSDEDLITVDATGLATMVPGITIGGTVDIILRVTNPAGGYFEARVTITVTIVYVTGMTLNHTNLARGANTTAVQLTPSFTPAHATDTRVGFVSSDDAIVAVSATGLVTFVAEGLATITATALGTASGVTVTAIITVEVFADGVIVIASAADWNEWAAQTTDTDVTIRDAALNAHVILINDIDFDGGALLPVGGDVNATPAADWRGLDFPTERAFTGTFDGRGFTILNFEMIGTVESYHMGMFRLIMGATIRNLEVRGAVRSGGRESAVLVGQARGSSANPVLIENIVIIAESIGGGAGHALPAALIGRTSAGAANYHITVRNIVTHLTSTASRSGMFGYMAGGIGSRVATNLFVVSDNLVAYGPHLARGDQFFFSTTASFGLNNFHAITRAQYQANIVDFSSLPSNAWVFEYGVLPRLRRIGEPMTPVTVTGNNLTTSAAIVAGSNEALLDEVYVFSVRVNTTNWHGTPAPVIYMDGVLITPTLTPSAVSGPATLREFTFVIPSVTGDIEIYAIQGLTQIFRATLTTSLEFTITALDPVLDGVGATLTNTVLAGSNFRFTLSLADGFELDHADYHSQGGVAFIVIGGNRTALTSFTVANGVYTFTVPYALITADFTIEIGDLVQDASFVTVAGIRTTALYQVVANASTRLDETFEFALNILEGAAIAGDIASVTIQVSVAGGGVHTLVGSVDGNRINFSLLGTYVVGPITIGAQTGIIANAWTRIATAADWNNIMNLSNWQNRNFYLSNNIDFGGTALAPIGGRATAGVSGTFPTPDMAFRGIFDGRGFAVENFTLDNTGITHGGMFRHLVGNTRPDGLGRGGIIRNIAVRNATLVHGGYRGAMLVGFATGPSATPALIENVEVVVTISAGSAGHGLPAAVLGSIRTGAAYEHVRVTNAVTRVTSTVARSGMFAYMPTGGMANRIGTNLFIVTDDLIFTDSSYFFNTHQGFTLAAGTTHPFTMANIGTVDFSALPSAYWNIESGELPSLRPFGARPAPWVGTPTVVNTASGEAFSNVTAPATATIGYELNFTAVVDTTRWHGAPTALGTMGGEPINVAYSFATGPANARVKTFTIPSVTGNVVINEIVGLTRIFHITLPTAEYFTLIGLDPVLANPTVLDGQDYRFTLSLAEGFALNDDGSVFHAVGATQTRLTNYAYDNGIYTFTVPASLINADFSIVIRDLVIGGAFVGVTGMRTTANYTVVADASTRRYEDFSFSLVMAMGNVMADDIENITISVLVAGTAEPHVLTGERVGSTVNFMLAGIHVTGAITIGEQRGVVAHAWIRISTEAEWNNIMNIPSWQTSNFYLANDIDFGGRPITVLGTPGNVGGYNAAASFTALHPNAFRGTIDGRGFALMNHTMNAPAGAAHWGLIRLSIGATIRNLELRNASVTLTAGRSSFLIGWALGTSTTNRTVVENVIVSGTINGGPNADWNSASAIVGSVHTAGAPTAYNSWSTFNNIVTSVNTTLSLASGFSGYAGVTTGNRTANNIFVVTNGLARTDFAHEGAGFTTRLTNIDSFTRNNLVRVDNTAFGATDFSSLPSAYWIDNVADGATALPRLRQLPLMPVPWLNPPTVTVEDYGYATRVEVPATTPFNQTLTFSVIVDTVAFDGAPVVEFTKSHTLNAWAPRNYTITHTAQSGDDPFAQVFTFTIPNVVGNVVITGIIGLTQSDNTVFEIDGFRVYEGAAITTSYAVEGPAFVIVGGDPGDDDYYEFVVTTMFTAAYGLAVTVQVYMEGTGLLTLTRHRQVVNRFYFRIMQADFTGDVTIGTVNLPVEFTRISTVADWNNIMELSNWQNRNFYLANDIDFLGDTLQIIGGAGYGGIYTANPEFAPDHYVTGGGGGAGNGALVFRGTFDGRGYALKNFYLPTATTHGPAETLWHAGVFRGIANATIENLTLYNANKNLSNNGGQGGLLVGRAHNSIIRNISIINSTSNNTSAPGAAWERNGAIAGALGANTILSNIVIDVTSDNTYFAIISHGAVGSATLQNIFIIDSARPLFNSGDQTGNWGTNIVRVNTSLLVADFSVLSNAHSLWQLVPGQIPMLVPASVTLVPSNVTFDLRGGSEGPDDLTDIPFLSVAPASPTRDGYVFAGWFASETDADLLENPARIPLFLTGDIELFAGWIPLVDVSADGFDFVRTDGIWRTWTATGASGVSEDDELPITSVAMGSSFNLAVRWPGAASATVAEFNAGIYLIVDIGGNPVEIRASRHNLAAGMVDLFFTIPGEYVTGAVELIGIRFPVSHGLVTGLANIAEFAGTGVQRLIGWDGTATAPATAAAAALAAGTMPTAFEGSTIHFGVRLAGAGDSFPAEGAYLVFTVDGVEHYVHSDTFHATDGTRRTILITIPASYVTGAIVLVELIDQPPSA